MTEVSSRRRTTAFFLLKLLIVLSFPLFLRISFLGITWSSLLLLVEIFFVDETSLIIFSSAVPILIALFIMSPCILFEYHLNRQPISKTIRGRAMAVSMFSLLISRLIPYTPMFFYEMSMVYATSYSYMLGIVFFVILPIIFRESMLRSISQNLRSLSYDFIKATVGKQARRGNILSGLVWAGLIFAPFIVTLVDSDLMAQTDLWSLFYQYRLYSDFPYLTYDQFLPSNSYEIVPMIQGVLIVFVLLSAIRIIFVRDIFRYRLTQITMSRLLSVAILGEILPAALLTLLTLVGSSTTTATFLILPIPILPLIGFAFIRFSKVIPLRNEIWPDQEYRMWYEKEREPYVPETADESIKVPITYLILSQVRKHLKE